MNNKPERDPKKLQDLKDYFKRNPHAKDRFVWTEEELMEDLSHEKSGPVIPVNTAHIKEKAAEFQRNLEKNISKEEWDEIQAKVKKENEEIKKLINWKW